MAFGVDDIQVIIDAMGSLIDVVFKILGVFIVTFLELFVDFLTGNIVSNVYMFAFFLIILSTTMILYLKFVAN